VRIHVDADGCPVKAEVLRVAKRCAVEVRLVANGGVDAPADPRVQCIVVPSGADVADDWIAEHAEPGDVVVTADVPLAARCVKKGAVVIHPTGRRFTEDDIGSALAMRDLLTRLRSEGERTRGPAPFSDRDRSEFLQTLDAVVQRGLRTARREAGAPPPT
jgi:uncharacterized protein